MEILYSSEKTKQQCNNLKTAQKLLGGNKVLAISLLARINSLEEATTLKDIVVQPTFHFHKLDNKYGRNLEGKFAIDVKSRKEPWRIILEPLDDNEEPFVPCNIDKIVDKVKIVEVVEVSNHYE